MCFRADKKGISKREGFAIPLLCLYKCEIKNAVKIKEKFYSTLILNMIHNKRLPTDCLAHLIVVSGSAVQAADSNAAVGFLRCVADTEPPRLPFQEPAIVGFRV